MSHTDETAIAPYVRAVAGKKAESIIALDVRPLTSVADVFIICSGRSNRQVSAIAEHIKRDLQNQQIRPISIEGNKEGLWVLMDYGNIVIHVFHDPLRSFYDLEGLWIDARRIDLKNILESSETRGAIQ